MHIYFKWNELQNWFGSSIKVFRWAFLLWNIQCAWIYNIENKRGGLLYYGVRTYLACDGNCVTRCVRTRQT